MPEIDNLQDRVLQIENLVFDLPNLMNSRLDGVEGHIRAMRLAFEDTGARLGRIEKIQGLLQADVRDLRNGVTLQLRLQHEQTTALADEVRAQGERLARVEGRLDGVESRLDRVESRLDRVESRLDGVERQLASMSVVLNAVAAKLDVRL